MCVESFFVFLLFVLSGVGVPVVHLRLWGVCVEVRVPGMPVDPVMRGVPTCGDGWYVCVVEEGPARATTP